MYILSVMERHGGKEWLTRMKLMDLWCVRARGVFLGVILSECFGLNYKKSESWTSLICAFCQIASDLWQIRRVLGI